MALTALPPCNRSRRTLPCPLVRSLVTVRRCRLEQWARVSQKGTDAMYVCDGGAPRDVSTDVSALVSSMDYMGGEYTVSDDRLNLVDASIALYYILLKKQKNAGLSPTEQQLLEVAKPKRDALFPLELFDDMMSIVEDEITGEGATFEKAMTRRKSMTKTGTKPLTKSAPPGLQQV